MLRHPLYCTSLVPETPISKQFAVSFCPEETEDVESVCGGDNDDIEAVVRYQLVRLRSRVDHRVAKLEPTAVDPDNDRPSGCRRGLGRGPHIQVQAVFRVLQSGAAKEGRALMPWAL
jgi:hypothetical protein